MMKRRAVCLCLALLLLLPMLLTGCSKELERNTLAFDTEFGYNRIVTDVVAENERFQLWWDDDAQCALLNDLTTGKWYSTTPYDYYMDMPGVVYADNLLYAPLNISYVKTNPDTYMSNIDYASAKSDSIDYTVHAPMLDENGNVIKDEATGVITYESEPEYIEHPNGMTIPRSGVSSERIENGVRINYAFPALEISVSLELILNEKGLEARIPMDRIQENANRIYEISVLPSFVSAINGDDSYLFVPSGGGALINAKTLLTKKTYDEAVYGEDLSDVQTMSKHMSNQIHLPVFGARDANGGMIGVIQNGTACGRIKADVGDPELGYVAEDGTDRHYSTVCAAFRVRGHEEIMYNSMGGSALPAPSYSDSIASYDCLSVQYYPLGEDTSYMGMAAAYRQHLQDKGYLQNGIESVPALSVSYLGAVQTPESFFGVPYKADTATTDLKSAKEITEELNALVNNGGLLVNLKGYGMGGLTNTVVGGDFKLSGSVGGKKDLQALQSYAADNNVILSMDYEAMLFQKGSSGFGVNGSTTHNISQLDVETGTYTLNTAVQNDNGDFWYLLSRGKVSEAIEKALAANKKNGFNAISFGSLGYSAYSDYRDANYTAKAHMDEDVAAWLNQCREAGQVVVTTKANEYAALAADYIIEAPTASSKYSVLSKEIPFYALVFQGYKGLTSQPINTSINVREAYLKAVSTGATLQFTLCDELHDSIQFEQNTAYITGVYGEWKDDIAAMVQESAELHSKVGAQSIAYYSIDNGLSITMFEDGTTVYVNYTNEPMESDLGTIPAMGFIYG